MYTPKKNLILIQRVREALKDDGILVILDQIASKGRGSARLKSSGFNKIRCRMLRKAPSSGLVIGVKKP